MKGEVRAGLRADAGRADNPERFRTRTQMAEPAPQEHPEGLEIRRRLESVAGGRPDWLVRADEVVQGGQAPDRPELPSRGPGEPRPDPRSGWKAASSSIPKLAVSAGGRNPLGEDEDEDPDSPETTGRKLDPPSKDAVPAGNAIRRLKPLDEPWWLVWAENLVSDRRMWVGALIVVVAASGFMVWRARTDPGVSLSAIKRHAQRYEGRSVTVRGKVGEVFEIGQGFVFNLHQGRDTIVVFSPTRRPTPHEKVVVNGTVSAGYLDGLPRVAVFETP